MHLFSITRDIKTIKSWKTCSLVLLFLLLPTASFSQAWLTDLDSALVRASAGDKQVLLVFSGYDWCAPCIRFRSQVLNTTEFLDYASGNLVLVNIDFPRKKKNRPSPGVEKRNKDVADIYNKLGEFPKVLLIAKDGSDSKVVDHSFSEPWLFIMEIEQKRKELEK